MLKISKSLIMTFLVMFLFTPSSFAATAIPFTINLSEIVNVTGTPRIAVDVGGVTRYATYASGSGTSTLTFTYSMVAGDVDLDGATVSSPIDLNGGTIKDLAGNDLSPLTFTAPNTTNVKVNYPSLGMDFIYDADGRYTLNGTAYNDLNSFLSAAGGTFSRASVGTYFDSAGILQTAASSMPRFDYEPVTHVAKGFLIEESRTNVVKYSEDFANGSNWFNTQMSVTPNVAISPAGTTTAELLTRTGTSGGVYQQQLYSGSTGTYTVSIFAKAATIGNQFGLRIQGTYPDRGDVKFNLATGVVISTLASGNYTNASATIKHVGNGWYRLTLTVTANTSNVSRVLIGPTDSTLSTGGWEAADAILSDVYVWGAQLEQGAFATSYIPTTTAAVTRPADYLTIPTGAWYNQSAGTFYDDTEWVSIAGANYPMLFRVDDTTNNNRWNAFYKQSTSTIGVDAFNSGISQGSWFSMTTSTSGTKKLAAAQSLNNANAAFDGIIQTLDTTWTPPTITRLVLSGGSSTASIWQKSLKYYPLRVSDDQLQLLTQ